MPELLIRGDDQQNKLQHPVADFLLTAAGLEHPYDAYVTAFEAMTEKVDAIWEKAGGNTGANTWEDDIDDRG